jgi:hypothetical protein
VAGLTTTYTHNAANRLTAVNGVSVTHDAHGCLTAFGSDTYAWDVRGRLRTLYDHDRQESDNDASKTSAINHAAAAAAGTSDSSPVRRRAHESSVMVHGHIRHTKARMR